MATEYALQHRTSQRYLGADPTLHVHVETPDQDKAFTTVSMTESCILREEYMGDFAEAWDVVPVARPDRSPYPLEREGPRA